MSFYERGPVKIHYEEWGSGFPLLLISGGGLGVFAKHVVHPERSEKNGVATQPFNSEEAPDEAPS